MDANKKFHIIYFTGTGNTEYLFIEIKKRLIEKGHTYDMLSVDHLWRDCGRMPGIHGDSNLVSEKLRMKLLMLF